MFVLWSFVEIRNIGGENRKACSNCDFVFWGNYSIGVGALIIKDEKILLVRRCQNQEKVCGPIQAGLSNSTNRLKMVLIREVFEETGITSKVNGIIALWGFTRDIHNVYIAFSMDYVEGNPQPDNVEVDGAGFFSLNEMESINVAGLTRQLATTAFENPSHGLISDTKPVSGHELYRVQKIK